MFGKLFSRASGFFFSSFVEKITPHFKELERVLSFTDINESVDVYLANLILLSLIVGGVLEFFMIFVLFEFNFIQVFMSIFITLFISAIFVFLIFFTLYKYPFYIVDNKKKKIEVELELSIQHLSALDHEKLSVRDVLMILQAIEGNDLLKNQSMMIIKFADLNKNLKNALNYAYNNTYSEQEHLFLSKLIDVVDEKTTLSKAINEYLDSIEQSKKDRAEEKKVKLNLLFQINILLFIILFMLVFSIFLMPVYEKSIKDLLFAIAIIFPIVELLLVFIINR